MRNLALLAILFAAYASPLLIAAQEDAGPGALKAKYQEIRPKLEKNAFGRPLHLDSGDANGKMNGDVYAVLDHPFKRVSDGLSSAKQWCEVLVLPFNVQKCESDGGKALKLYVGRKPTSPIEEATKLDFDYSVPARADDHLQVKLSAPSGPAGTKDYLITFAATPLDDKRTMVHMHYGYSTGTMSQMAMKTYLSTSGADKVGFSSENGKLVGGTRGVIERNAMRYFLAIDAYLDTLGKPATARFDKWFGQTEKYAKQLREMSREEYLAVKQGGAKKAAG
ncbi:MAG TPA: hypothetical protein VFV90_03855 [Usitatibacter sp.]|nr:hypothetical protein [Usitatibacter sp.]